MEPSWLTFGLLSGTKPVARSECDNGRDKGRGEMVSQFSLSVFSGEVTFRLEVCMAGSSHGHEEPVDRCGAGGAALVDGHCRSLWKELGTK